MRKLDSDLVPKAGDKLRTLKELAGALKTPLPTVGRWVRHAMWKWNRRGPWSRKIAPDVLRWAADNLQSGRPELDPSGKVVDQNDIRELRKEKLRKEIHKLRLQADVAETELMKERGALHDADACERQRVADGHRVANAIQILPSQVISIVLSHGMPHEASAVVQDQISKICNTVLRLLSNEGSTDTDDREPEVLPSAVPA